MRSIVAAIPFLLCCAHVPTPCERTTALRHEFGFSLPDFAVQHQGEAHRLNLDVRYHYNDDLTAAQYPDFVPIAKEVSDFVGHYDSPNDFWEVMNQRLIDRLMKEHPELSDMAIEIQVDPTSRLPYHRFSRVTRSREGCLPIGR